MVFSELWWQFQPGQSVNTKEGYPGVVTDVQDGGEAGNETYLVQLDGGLGGGEYSSSELSALGTPVAAHKIEADLYTESDLINTADADYPEFGSVLQERLPMPVSIPATDYLRGMTAAKHEDDEDRWDDDGGTPHEAKGIMEWDMLRGKSSIPIVNWCRFRGGEDSAHCFLPKLLNLAATKEAGYPVWIPEDRGPCPRLSRKQQRECPVGQPGPGATGYSVRPNRPDATIPWDEGGQRGGTPEPGYMDEVMARPQFFGYLVKSADLTSEWLDDNDGGFSILNFLAPGPTDGYMVSANKASEKVIPKADFDHQAVVDYQQANSYLLSQPNAYLGAWTNDDNVYLDISHHYPSKMQAMKVGEKAGQLAVWDVAKSEDIPLSSMQSAAFLKGATAAHLWMATNDASFGTKEQIFFDIDDLKKTITDE